MTARSTVTALCVFSLLSALLLSGLATSYAQTPPAEIPVQIVALSGPAAESEAEISGLAWMGDSLILMAENPAIYAQDGYAGLWFALDKGAITAYLDAAAAGAAPAPLVPTAVPLIAPDIAATVPGFDGFEAVIVYQGVLYAVIEASGGGGTMRGVLVRGAFQPDLSAITLDLGGAVEIAPQTDYFNISYESIFAFGDRLTVLYEINGVAVNPDARAPVFDLNLNPVDSLPMPSLEYRLTDVTEPGADGVFWAINYYFTGDDFLLPSGDPLIERYGRGATHAVYPQIERLVAFQYTGTAITLLDRAPLYLELPNADARNWEGIVRLDGRGFLLVTDKYPQTLLGFVPYQG